MDMDQIHEQIRQLTSDPGHVAKSDQLRASGVEFAMAQMAFTIDAEHAVAHGDRDARLLAMMQQAKMLREADKETLCAAIGAFTSLVAASLVDQWGSIDKLVESLADPDVPLFPETPVSAHCASCDGHACEDNVRG